MDANIFIKNKFKIYFKLTMKFKLKIKGYYNLKWFKLLVFKRKNLENLSLKALKAFQNCLFPKIPSLTMRKTAWVKQKKKQQN